MCGVCGTDDHEEMGAEAPERQGPGEEIGLRGLLDPRLPSEEEVAHHNLTHVPYRNWCPHCVKGRGKDLDHRKSVKESRAVKEFGFDYCFPGDEFGFKWSVIVGVEKVTGMKMASVVLIGV